MRHRSQQRGAQLVRFHEAFGDRGGSGTGVGLGLAVARGFVEAMGGQIVAEDTPGGGLTMVISLPAVPERMDAAGGDRGWQR